MWVTEKYFNINACENKYNTFGIQTAHIQSILCVWFGGFEYVMAGGVQWWHRMCRISAYWKIRYFKHFASHFAFQFSHIYSTPMYKHQIMYIVKELCISTSYNTINAVIFYF